jgi:hypothetical protein
MEHGLMSYDVKLMPGSPMPFGQLKYLLMSPVGGFPAPSSWQVLPPSMSGCYLYSSWQQSYSAAENYAKIGN